MRLTFPHMGNLYIALEGIFNYLDLPVIIPPPINKETINVGTKYTPESACLPFKIMFGNFVQAIEQGADTIIMLGGSGPCRFGYFATLADVILKQKGYSYEMVILEGENLIKEINKLRVKNGVSYFKLIEAIWSGWTKLKAIDEIEKLTLFVRPREAKPGATSHLFNEAIPLIRQSRNVKEINSIKIKCLAQIDKLKTSKKVLRIGLVGDIYMMLEPAANYRLERLLGALGVEVHRSIFVSDWLKHTLVPHKISQHKRRLLDAGKPYLNNFVGGHGLDTVANTVLYAGSGFDGVIQIMPMTCMPEIVAQSILPKVQKELDIPILKLVLDEHSGEAGMITRIEAFVDLLNKKLNFCTK